MPFRTMPIKQEKHRQSGEVGLEAALQWQESDSICRILRKQSSTLMINNSQLDTFLRVADAGSFNKAAEESYITPTAVIKQINLLESSLDVKLFERTHRGLILTKAGKSLYQDTKCIIQYCKDSVTRAKNAMQEDTNIIRIGTSPMTPAQLLMQLWPKIQEKCPDMKFQIIPYENTPENAKHFLSLFKCSTRKMLRIFGVCSMKGR